MRHLFTSAILCALGTLLATPALAQSAKNTVQVGNVSLLGSELSTTEVGGWNTIMAAGLKTANYSDAVVGVSLEAGLFTSTTVRSKGGKADTSWAEAMIEVRVLVDGVPAFPGAVTFERRYQEMMARFGGIVDSCTDANEDGTIDFETECIVTDEELRLVLQTMNAHTFNFILPDLSSGYHHVDVQARITTDSDAEAGASGANAVIGKGSVVVEEVRLVKDLDISL